MELSSISIDLEQLKEHTENMYSSKRRVRSPHSSIFASNSISNELQKLEEPTPHLLPKNDVPYLQRALEAQLPIELHASERQQARYQEDQEENTEEAQRKLKHCFPHSLSNSLRTSLWKRTIRCRSSPTSNNVNLLRSLPQKK